VEKKKAQAGQHWFFQTLILLFVLVWVFILGIFIGRGYLMESTAGRELIAWIEDKMDRQPAVPQISIEQPAESAAAERSPAPGPEAATEPPAAPPMIEPQGAEAPENAVLQTVVSAAQSVGPDTAPVPPAAPEEALADSPVFLTPETLAEEAPTESEPAAPAVFIPPPPVAPPVAASAASGGYAVQATYALNEQAAQAVVDRLKRQGLQAYFYENSRKQYLIRVGHFQNIEEARSAREKLSSLGYKDPYISRLTTEE
jgi:septal ring-binding cell division protein DamX